MRVIDDSDLEGLAEVLASENWSEGEKTQEFESDFSQFLGVENCVLTPNGTAAFELGLRALEIGHGDEVIVPAVTWPSIPAAVIRLGATPVTADIDLNTFAMSASTVKQALTHRTKAIVATHLYSSLCDTDELINLVRERNIVVVEDAAQSVGSKVNGRSCGVRGRFGFFSFNTKKVLTCGEGGCLATDDFELADRVRRLKDFDLSSKIGPPALPQTSLVSEFQSSILVSQLKKLPSLLERQLSATEQIRQALSDHKDTLRPLAKIEGVDVQSNYSFVFLFSSDVEGFENLQADVFQKTGIRIARTYPPLSEIDFGANKSGSVAHLYAGLARVHQNASMSYRRSVRIPNQALSADRDALLELVSLLANFKGVTSND